MSKRSRSSSDYAGKKPRSQKKQQKRSILTNVPHGPKLNTRFIDTIISRSPLNAADGINGVKLINATMQGASATSRIGSSFSMKYCQIRLSMHLSNDPTMTAYEGGVARLAVIYDKRPSAAPPSITDIYAATYLDGSGEQRAPTQEPTAKPTSPLNMTNRDRFIVLADELVNLPAVDVTPPAGANLRGVTVGRAVIDTSFKNSWERYINLQKLPVQCKNGSNTGDLSDIQSGALWLVVFGDEGMGTANNSPFQWRAHARLKFLEE